MAANAQCAQRDWETVDHKEECLNGNDCIDHATEQSLCKDGVLFD